MTKNKNKKNKTLAFFLIFLIVFNCIVQTSCSKQDFSNGSLKIFFCGQYLADSNSGSVDVIKEFEKQHKIKISAYSTFDSNEQLFAKLKYSKIDYDIILPSDYMISKLIKENMLQKIDKNKLKTYSKINDYFKGSNCGFDPADEFSVPYSWGTIGLIYNVHLVEKLTGQKAESVVNGFNCLFNEKLKNEILMFSNSKDSFAVAQKALGNSINTTNASEIEAAAKLLKKQKKLVQLYGIDEIADKMINNEAAVAPASSDDGFCMMKENKNLKFFLPDKSILFVDAMCIPKNAKNTENALKFIDFMCLNKIAALNCNFSSLSTTIDSALDCINEEIKNSEVIYPAYSKIKNCETQNFSNYETEQKIAKLWEQIKI